MKCQCPACGRTTWIPREQLDFVVRCDRCRTLLLTRTASPSPAKPDEPPVEVVPLIQVAEGLRDSEHSGLDLADLMTRRQSRRTAKTPPKPRTSRNPGFAIWTVLLVTATLALLALAAVRWAALRHVNASTPQAPADIQPEPDSTPPTPAPSPTATPVTVQTARKPAPQHAVQSTEETPAPTGNGELFPEVSAK